MFGGKNFRPDVDIPDLSGKVILVTGGMYAPIRRQGDIGLTELTREYGTGQGDCPPAGEAQACYHLPGCPHRLQSRDRHR